MSIFYMIAAILVSYLIGAIPASFLFAKIFSGIDIRKHGSGNVGATNVYRVAGKLPGLLALLLDIGKGAFVVTLVASFFYKFVGNIDWRVYRLVLAFFAFVGHIWTVFLGFKGGKGVATSAGILIILAPKVLLLSFVVWLLVFAWKRFVSLASVVSSVSLPVFALIFEDVKFAVFCIILCCISIYKHKTNIGRLINGTEYKFGKQQKVSK